MSSPNLVGITGGIGSGKSTVCKIFEVLGLKVYYADDRAKELMLEPEVVKEVESIFGSEAYANGTLNRPFIAKKAFNDKQLLTQLNDVVHPVVKRDFEQWISQNGSEEILLKEAALLIEAGSCKELDKLILITSEEQTRIDRVLARDAHRTEQDIRKIIDEQLSDDEKIPLADFIIKNDGNNSLIKQVVEIHEQLVVT